MSDNIDVVIYKPTKSAMQSGLATNKFWILKYVSYSKTNLDPLMGWSGSDDTSKQIVLKFKFSFMLLFWNIIIGSSIIVGLAGQRRWKTIPNLLFCFSMRTYQ